MPPAEDPRCISGLIAPEDKHRSARSPERQSAPGGRIPDSVTVTPVLDVDPSHRQAPKSHLIALERPPPADGLHSRRIPAAAPMPLLRQPRAFSAVFLLPHSSSKGSPSASFFERSQIGFPSHHPSFSPKPPSSL